MVSHAAPLSSPKFRGDNQSSKYAVAVYDAPVIDPLLLISQDTCTSTYLWLPPAPKRAWVGVGCLEKIIADDTSRFATQKEQAADLFSNLKTLDRLDERSAKARLFGGFSFSEQAAEPASEWTDFRSSEFILPRWAYELDGDRAFVTIYYPSASNPDSAKRRAFAHLARMSSSPRETPHQVLQLEEEVETQTNWNERIGQIQKAIGSGEAAKVVAARITELKSDRPIHIRKVLESLREADPTSTVFSFPSNQSVFVGATPETLVRKVDSRLYTEALAGTVNSQNLNADDDLKNSVKDQDEHQFVRDYILSKIEGLCSTLNVAPEPALRRLKDVMHLCTSITGELADHQHILDLVEALHPTPAVAGMPVTVAQSIIDRIEPFSRGWYSGPIGWFDNSGDGEFAVALRCGLINGSQAHLFAGAGIVRDSETSSEYEETRLKQQPLLRALRQG